mmetsp:Transcript_21110/g.52347  ORF Transcript_21110/g.52347 Transcript_21110/m.52347 type:complete len:114 (+) Transcript_21110:110-451(+)
MYSPQQQPIELCLRVKLSHRARLPPVVDALPIPSVKDIEKAVSNADFSPPSLSSDGSFSDYSMESPATTPFFGWRGKKNSADNTSTATNPQQSETLSAGQQRDRLPVDLELTC